MTTLIPAIYVSHLAAIGCLFGFSTFCYAAWSTMALALPSDLYASRNVASVSGMSGTGAGLGTILSTYLIGYAADRYSFGSWPAWSSLSPPPRFCC
jgi:MFS transporter, ACS family, hexuronate transporter